MALTRSEYEQYLKECRDTYATEQALRREGREEVAENLILQTDFSDEKIANIANVSLEFVQRTRKKSQK